MKKLGFLMVFVLALTLLVGCLPSWLQPVDPVVPDPEPEVVVNAILEDGEVDWSIENISESHIYDYSLTFTVLYEDVEVPKTQWEEKVLGVNLYPGDVDFGTLVLPLVQDMEPVTLVYVLATY